ncbi:hypothetical protein EON67_06380, partial [archaeon]
MMSALVEGNPFFVPHPAPHASEVTPPQEEWTPPALPPASSTTDTHAAVMHPPTACEGSDAAVAMRALDANGTGSAELPLPLPPPPPPACVA